MHQSQFDENVFIFPVIFKGVLVAHLPATAWPLAEIEDEGASASDEGNLTFENRTWTGGSEEAEGGTANLKVKYKQSKRQDREGLCDLHEVKRND